MVNKFNEVLRFEDICLTYQGKNSEVEALKNINFKVNQGQLVSIVGPSGCGKTTLLSLIAGLEDYTTGKIFINGKESKGLNSTVGYMLQRDSLLSWRTIRSNALLGLEIRKMLTAENIEYVDHLLKAYGLWEFRNSHPGQLSGGMRQRAALIRTMATKPNLLLLDEAFSALDYQTRLVVADDVTSILKRENKTAVIVTHDISESITMSSRIIVLSKRPGQVRLDINLDFKTSGLERREEPQFREYFNLIWKEIDLNVEK